MIWERVQIKEMQPGEITRLLGECRENAGARERLIEMVYDEMRGMARRKLAGERAGHSLQATEIANEVYLRFLAKNVQIESRGHLIWLIDEGVRRVLVDHARKRKAKKRGGDWKREEINEEIHGTPPLPYGDEEDDPEEARWARRQCALERLRKLDPRGYEIIQMRRLGMTDHQIGDELGLSRETVNRQGRACQHLLSLWVKDSAETFRHKPVNTPGGTV